MPDFKKLSKACAWYALHADSVGLRAVLVDCANALERVAEREALDSEAEALISEAYA